MASKEENMTDDQTTNNKLVVLFVMEKFEMPLTEDTLLSICCTENNWLRYLYCKQVLNELIKSGFVNRTTLPGNNVSLLKITSDGRSCIAYFYNELPLSLVLSWYEQKAVCILLTLLHLGIKNILLGPTLPAFVSPNVLNFLVEHYNIAPVSTPEEDLKKIL